MHKPIESHSLLELLEILEDTNHELYSIAEEELAKRNPKPEVLAREKKGLEIKNRVKNRSLTIQDKLYAYSIPLHTWIGPRIHYNEKLTKAFDEQIKAFEDFGEEKKALEFEKLIKSVTKTYHILGIVIIIIALLFILIDR